MCSVTIRRDNCTDCTLGYYFNLDWFPIVPSHINNNTKRQQLRKFVGFFFLFSQTNIWHITSESVCFILLHKAAKPLTGCADVWYAKCTQLFYKQCEKVVQYQSEGVLWYYWCDTWMHTSTPALTPAHSCSSVCGQRLKCYKKVD